MAWGLPVLVLVFSMALKAIMFAVVFRAAKRVQSPTLHITAVDNLIDTVTSCTAIVGIIVATVGIPFADPIAAILVSIWIFRAAYHALRDNLAYLTGGGASEQRLQQYREAIIAMEGVIDVHRIVAEHIGTRYLLEVHVNVDGNTPLFAVHEVETQIERRLMGLPDVERAYIHVEPPGFS